MTTKRYSEPVTALVTPEMKTWLKEISDGFPFESEGAAIRMALEAMKQRGPVKTLEELQLRED